jgi:hypothetical protein
MNDDTPTQTGELGAMPESEIEPREPNPGGVDALPEEPDNVAADLDPEKNQAIDDSPDPVKEAFSEGEDTHTKATKSDDSGEDVPPEDESPA